LSLEQAQTGLVTMIIARLAAGSWTGGPDFCRTELIVKVKEPLAAERSCVAAKSFSPLHLAPDPRRRDLLASGATCIAYETVTSPFSCRLRRCRVAGRPAPQAGTLPEAQGGAASCWVVCRACHPPVVILEAAYQARIGQQSRSVWAPMSLSLIGPRRCCAALAHNSARGANHLPRATRSRRRAARRPPDRGVLVPGAAEADIREMVETMKAGAVIVTSQSTGVDGRNVPPTPTRIDTWTKASCTIA
jgi:alanine dehydrogenase